MSAGPEIQVTLCMEQSLGDHGERVRIAHRVEPGETVERLVQRLMQIGEHQPAYRRPLPSSDWIELRYVEGTALVIESKDAPF